MSAYVDGELTGVEMLEIRRHLSDCPECAEEHESIRVTKQAVSRLRSAAPRRDLAASILLSLDEVQVTSYQRAVNATMRFLHGRLSPVAAALAASGLALVLLSAGGVDRIQPDTSQTVAMSRVQNVAFLREIDANPAIPTARPLVVASDRSDFGGTQVQFASLTK